MQHHSSKAGWGWAVVKVWDNSQLQLPSSRASLGSLRGLWLRKGSCHSQGHLLLQSSESLRAGISKKLKGGQSITRIFPSLEIFEARLDGTLGNLFWWKMSLHMAWGVEQMIFKVHPKPNQPVIL